MATRTTTVKGFTDETPRRERQIKNRLKYRLAKRVSLYTRSISIAKDKKKIAVLQGKIDALTFALKTLDEV